MTSEKPIIVIIPGAFHKPIHYCKISKLLQSDGYEVLEVSHIVCGDKVDPEKTFFDDAAEIRKKLIPLSDQGRHAVIMSHSYGSLPATASVEGQTVIERAERGLVGGIVAVISIAGFVFYHGRRPNCPAAALPHCPGYPSTQSIPFSGFLTE